MDNSGKGQKYTIQIQKVSHSENSTQNNIHGIQLETVTTNCTIIFGTTSRTYGGRMGQHQHIIQYTCRIHCSHIQIRTNAQQKKLFDTFWQSPWTPWRRGNRNLDQGLQGLLSESAGELVSFRLVRAEYV